MKYINMWRTNVRKEVGKHTKINVRTIDKEEQDDNNKKAKRRQRPECGIVPSGHFPPPTLFPSGQIPSE